MKLLNKVCVVTGSSRGIGRAMALGFAREGADVVIAARTEVQQDERLPGTIHTTAEEVEIDTVGNVYDLLIATLTGIKD